MLISKVPCLIVFLQWRMWYSQVKYIWELSLNTSKTHCTCYMLISSNREINAFNSNSINIHVASDEIERKDCCTFLGLMIDDRQSQHRYSAAHNSIHELNWIKSHLSSQLNWIEILLILVWIELNLIEMSCELNWTSN